MKLNKDLINKLKQGHIAIDNQGNPNVELLRVVLKEAFPLCSWNAVGNCINYSKNRNDNDWTSIPTNLPTIPLNDFLEKEQFPKNDFGVIVENNNGKEIINYLVSKGFNNINNFNGSCANNAHYGVYKHSQIINNWYSSSKISKTYTLQQLKNLENNMENKEIEKYQVLQDVWGYKGVKWIKGEVIYITNEESLTYFKTTGLINNTNYFKPVYKSKEVVIRMGNSFDLTIKDGKVFHGKSENITNFVVDLVNHYNKLDFPRGFGSYDAHVKISFTKTGCESNTPTTLEEWIAVYNELQKQK